MKTLYVVRHAKSSWDDPRLADADRPLNERGRRDAPRMGKRLKEREVTIDRVISSPANRAITTATVLSEVIGISLSSIEINPQLYHADEDVILNVVQRIADVHDSVMLAGHNPGLTDFVNRLATLAIDNVPTCGVVAIRLAIRQWSACDWGCGTLLFFDYPKLVKSETE